MYLRRRIFSHLTWTSGARTQSGRPEDHLPTYSRGQTYVVGRSCQTLLWNPRELVMVNMHEDYRIRSACSYSHPSSGKGYDAAADRCR